MDKKKKLSVPLFVVIQLAVCLYTISEIPAKFASRYDFLSWNFVLFYVLEIVLLGIYAILWQQIIKRTDISVAYANRATAIFWSMLWASVIFKETITLKNIIGILIVFFGTWMVNSDE